MTDEELIAMISGLDTISCLRGMDAEIIQNARAAITTLRAQLAEATKLAAAGNLIALELRVTEGLAEDQRARAERAEAALAVAFDRAADEADEHKHFAKGIECCGDCIRLMKPETARQALDRYREKALREAAKTAHECNMAGDPQASSTYILALIEKPNAR